MKNAVSIKVSIGHLLWFLWLWTVAIRQNPYDVIRFQFHSDFMFTVTSLNTIFFLLLTSGDRHHDHVRDSKFFKVTKPITKIIVVAADYKCGFRWRTGSAAQKASS